MLEPPRLSCTCPHAPYQTRPAPAPRPQAFTDEGLFQQFTFSHADLMHLAPISMGAIILAVTLAGLCAGE